MRDEIAIESAGLSRESWDLLTQKTKDIYLERADQILALKGIVTLDELRERMPNVYVIYQHLLNDQNEALMSHERLLIKKAHDFISKRLGLGCE